MEQEEKLALLITSVLILLLAFIVIVLFVVFQRRKNKLLLEQQENKKRFESEIAETEIEIREQTLRNISWELHDNIGQLLTLAKIQLQNTSPESINEVKETISKSLREIRSLSKLINPEAIKNIKLRKATQLEVDRFNRLNFVKSTLKVTGKERNLEPKVEIIIFRILQEFLSNTIKHSKASNLDISFDYQESKLIIIAKDNGIGFDESSFSGEKGIGLQNIQNRGKLINAIVNLSSEVKKGTTLTIIYTL